MCRISSFLSQSFPGAFKQQQTVSPNPGPYTICPSIPPPSCQRAERTFLGDPLSSFYRPYSFAAPSKPGIPDTGIPCVLSDSPLCLLLRSPSFFLSGWFFKIAAGCSCLLGTELKTNFQKPFLSVTIRQFWDRWQITFTDWLKEFIFCPLLKRFKKSRQFSCPLLQKCLGYLLTMGVLGVFYGITPSSLLFALYHGVVLCLWEVWETKSHLHEKWKHQPVYTFFTWIFTMLLLLFGFFILSGMFLKILFL